MDSRRGTCMVASFLHFLTYVILGDTCRPSFSGAIISTTIGCYDPYEIYEGVEVHVVGQSHTLVMMNSKGQPSSKSMGRIKFTPLKKQKNIILVLASVPPISWVVYQGENLNIIEIMLIAENPEEVELTVFNSKGVRLVDSETNITRRALPYVKPNDCKCSNNDPACPQNIVLSTYGYVTSYSCTPMIFSLFPLIINWDSRLIASRTPKYPSRDSGGGKVYPTLVPSKVTPSVADSKVFPESMFIGVMMTAFFGFLPLFLCLCCVCFRARRIRSHPPIVSGFVPVSGSGGHNVRIAGAYPPGEFPPSIHITGAHPPKYPTAHCREAAEPIAPPPYEEVNFCPPVSPPPYEEVQADRQKNVDS